MLFNMMRNQSQTPSKYDEAERVRQRMEDLRRHHAESSEIHSRTQPIIDEQIHEDTIKYLKSNQVNGTKTKSQKPRAPKRQRTSTSSNSTVTTTNTSQTYNGTYDANNYQSAPMNYPQPNHIQQQQHQHQQQPHPQHQTHQQHQHAQPILHNPHIQPTLSQNGHVYQHGYNQQNYHNYYQPQHPSNNSHYQHNNYQTLPNDLDLNLQAGLECDIDSLIQHEMSVEGQLDFNNDLLLKLDNHYQAGHQ